MFRINKVTYNFVFNNVSVDTYLGNRYLFKKLVKIFTDYYTIYCIQYIQLSVEQLWNEIRVRNNKRYTFIN